MTLRLHRFRDFESPLSDRMSCRWSSGDSLQGHRVAVSLPAARIAGTALIAFGSPLDCLRLDDPTSLVGPPLGDAQPGGFPARQATISRLPCHPPGFRDFESPSLRLKKKPPFGGFPWRREGDSNPRYWLTQYTRLAGEPDRPLRHLSKAFQVNVGGRLAQGFLPGPASGLQEGGSGGRSGDLG